MRLTDEDKARVRAEHPLSDVLARAGAVPPPSWDGHRDYKVCCPMPGHHDTTPSMIVHPDTGRYHCFGCGAHGDVMQLVMSTEGVTSLAKAAEILDSRRPLTRSGAQVAPAVELSAVERPDLHRTLARRLLAANAEAWHYYTLPQLADRARQYLIERGIDVGALEEAIGAPVAGHTPWSDIGLVDHLRRRGFTDDELVDAGWGSRRPNGTMTDRFRRRVLLPARDEHHHIIGVYGRDVTGRASAKYLNTPDTTAFSKGRALYRPTRTIDSRATVIVCEGTVDALAIAASAAAAGVSHCYAPVSPSGTALTAHHRTAILAMSSRPPVICADGDPAGIAAAAQWAEMFISAGREPLATLLPHRLDPAEWMARTGPAGLAAFLDTDSASGSALVRPCPAGAIIARAALDRAISRNERLEAIREPILARLGRIGSQLPGRGSQHRFAASAARVLAAAELGPDGWLTRRLVAAAAKPNSATTPRWGTEPAVDSRLATADMGP